MNWNNLLLIICLFGYCNIASAQGDLLQQSKDNLTKAQHNESDFKAQKELAHKAAEGFKELGIDSLLLDSKLLIAQAAYYTGDTTTFIKEIDYILELAQTINDTSAIVKAYNFLGFYQFSQGDVIAGIATLKTPDLLGLYSEQALEENITNLGALIDVGLGYTMNLDTVYYYVNKLQELAQMYPDPSVQVVSRFKLASLYSKSFDYKESIAILKEASPYLSKVDNKGFLHYYYRILINNYISINEPDSAKYYINKLDETAGYKEGDPRNCYLVVSKVRADLKLGLKEEIPAEFESCFQTAYNNMDPSNKVSVNTLGALYSKCGILHAKKQWSELDKILPKLIIAAKSSKSNEFLELSYELQYQSYYERGLLKKALDAHISFKDYSDRLNHFVFTQSQSLIRNQQTIELARKENSLLQNNLEYQKLRLDRDKNFRYLFILGLILMGFVAFYFIQLSRLRKKQGKELSRLVKERTSQLEESNATLLDTNQRLSQSNMELERFAFLTSHDLKTPLHNIIKFTELIDQKIDQVKDPSLKEYLGLIKRGGRQMDALITDVLEYSQLSKPQGVSSVEACELNEIFDDITIAISQYIKDKNAIIEIMPELVTIRANRSNLFILFKNLLENGIKYNDSSAPIVKVAGVEGDTHYTITVDDNGIGIDPDYKDQVFGMFTRLHSHSQYEGSGIGLAACKKVVDDLGGQIEIESEVGKGSEVVIKIPNELIENVMTV